MSDHTDHDSHGGHGGRETHHGPYVRIWVVLVVLLLVSVAGPIVASFVEHRPTALAITLSTAFGIAVVKAYMVVKNFMHINFAQRFVPYLVVTMLVLMFLFFAGTSPDVMKAKGRNWEKPSWIADNVEYQQHHPGGAPGGEHH